MKLGVLSQWFDPEPGPAAIPGVLSREWVAAGHHVSVLTGFPNYPTGELYPGYSQRLRDTSRHEGMSVTRVPLYASHNASGLHRAANYVSFAASAAALGGRALRGSDAVWVYNSPVTVALPLLTHTRWGGLPYFLHVQDLWPDSLLSSGMVPGGRAGVLVERAVSAVVRLMERRATVVGVISPGVRRLILDRNPDVDPARIVYVPNPTDEDLFRPVDVVRAAEPPTSTVPTFTLMYVGAIGEVQSLGTLLDAAELLRAERHIRFVLVGDGIARARLQSAAKDRGLDAVEFRGRVDKPAVPALMATADAQLVSLADSEFLRYTMPSKIASLLASRLPIIGHLAGDGADLITASGGGVISPPGDAWALANAITTMANMSRAERDAMGVAGYRYYARHLTARSAAHRIVAALEDAQA